MGRHGWPIFVGLMACSRAPDAEGPQAPSTGDDGTTEARPEPGAASTDAGADETTTTGDTGAGTRGCLAIVGGQQAGGGRLDLELAEGLIRDAGVFDDDHPALECAEIVDARGRWLAPAFIDSHVHLAYLPVAESLAARGVAAAVDLASPLEFLDERPARPQVIASGPMITAVGGYPTQSWGAGGYGLECATARDAIAAVDEVHAHGAGVVKIPFDHRPALPAEVLAAAVARARAHGLRIATHALDDAAAAEAAEAGADILAHTPVAPLAPATVRAWSGRAVITTLAAFGASASTRDNLAALREAGAVVLYGTDLGNTTDAGISTAEISAMQAAGMDGAAILAAGTSTPAAYWGLERLGSLAVGKAASVLVLDEDPTEQPQTLGQPAMVVLDGVRLDR